ncbi:Bug family tripartite tricarboxylate transporter substrate binding protein [Paracoccus laeviglucosivorans]|uniref:Tripartite-type tricarboxylate transporter, receptor component TctC n=1 Tax=Paracoccus laeviglucosivorans TaxID=1197861 RepID=A0A521ERJ4_9RHOB|nr:tripartite tricarboxylate transporter substrate binding protein [Paracoccus laeviglucosivorans]SMO86553.1 Tripartite-type tricarboxylate transporter, receptor component TctC [Paracoccus laeviglucosivorans]
MTIRMLAAAAIAIATLAPTISAHAAEYPAKPSRIVVPYNAGGAVDYVARVVAEALGKGLGQNFVVENRPGASASIGIQFVTNARADGYTLLFTSITSNAITAAMEPDKVGYDLKADLQPVGIVGRVPLVLVTSQNIPANTIAELIEYSKEQEMPISFASSGIGSTEHLGALAFAQAAGIEMQHIPYTGGAPAMTDVAAGRVDLMVATLPTAQPQIEAGNIKALVIANDERVEILPEVPTAKEASLEGFDVASVYGLLAPAKIDAQALETLRGSLDEIAKSPEFAKMMLDRGIIPNAEVKADPDAAYSAELDLWRNLVAQIETK